MAYNYPTAPPPTYATCIQDQLPVNLLELPSFTARSWDGDVSGDINFHPWNIEKQGGDGFRLEKTPIGSGCGDYPPELAGYEVCCIATSFGWCKRSQIVDLVQKGVAAHVLDNEKPPICVHEWFTSRTDCPGNYVIKVTLLDQSKREIPGSKLELSQTASAHGWKKVEKIFIDYPVGVRFVKFEDGGKDALYWKGFYGAKMVGAFVGVRQRPSSPAAPPPYSSLSGLTFPSSTYQIPLPPLRNLIENPNLRPTHGKEWDDSCCYYVDLFPWEEITRGGDGVRLERTPQGSRATGFPPELPAGQHCIATSHGWFKRRQDIDLVKNGYQPELMDQQRPSISICEWFTSRTDCAGLFYLVVSLLDEKKCEIPGQSFQSGERSPPSDRWEKVEHYFMNYPPGVRYIRFEDASKDTKWWSGFYGARMTGASVFVGSEQRK